MSFSAVLEHWVSRHRFQLAKPGQDPILAQGSNLRKLPSCTRISFHSPDQILEELALISEKWGMTSLLTLDRKL